MKRLHDLRLIDGSRDLPGVLLIHGFGMNGHFWEDPCSSFVLGGLAPLSVFLKDPPDNQPSRFGVSTGAADNGMKGMALRLAADGFPVASWSQQQPLGAAALAVAELERLVAIVCETWPGRPLYLVGHSRGGLIGRDYLGRGGFPEQIRGLITICSPHAGTELAVLSRFLTPLGRLLERLLPETGRNRLTGALARMADFLGSPAITELRPDADWIRRLPAALPGTLRLFSLGGVDPVLFSLFLRIGGDQQWRRVGLPDLLLRALPERHLPAELANGRGDGLVTAASARLPGGDHLDFPVNHVRSAFDTGVYRRIRELLLAHPGADTPGKQS